MKRKLVTFLTLLTLVLGVFSFAACGKYSKELEFVSYNDEYCEVAGLGDCEDTEIIIPSKYRGVPVTRIAERAFGRFMIFGLIDYCSEITSITIPDSVTEIGEYAFLGCNKVTSFNVDENNPMLKAVDGNLYSKDGKALIQYARGKTATSFVIPDGVIYIADFAFDDCDSLESITIPDSVTYIGDRAFSSCGSLTDITIPDSVEETGDAVFLGSGLTSVTFGENSKLTSIEDSMFAGCRSLTSIEIPDSVTSIGEGAFAEPLISSSCESLTSITIPDSVTEIGDSAFSGSGLTNITFGDNSQLTSIGKSMFSGCESLTSIEIPDSVTSIGDNAFYECSDLESVTFGENSRLASIGIYAFYRCKITSIEIPDNVTSIGHSVFSDCKSLTSISLPDSVTEIGDFEFDYCYRLASVKVGENNPKYKDIDGNLYTKDGRLILYARGKTATSFAIPDGVTAINGAAFRFCRNLKSITIPTSVTSIEDRAFYDCTGLTSITVDENNLNYKSIDGNLYTKDGTTLIRYADEKTQTSFVIPDGVTHIAGYAFYDCDNLTSIQIPDSVTSIEGGAFYSCNSLTNITIPDSVTYIGSWAFDAYGGRPEEPIYCEAVSQPSGWDENWNYSGRPVVWDCKNQPSA